MSKTSKMMLGATLGLLLVLILISAPAFAQISIDDNKCEDKCEDSILYLKGIWDIKLRQCVYAYEEPCKYGCEDNIKISTIPTCKEYPDTPPINETELSETSWSMIKSIYDKKITEIIVNVHGTEYQAGENGKIFLQLLDNERDAVNDSSCFSTIFYPNSTKWIDDALMSYADDGLYFYDVVIPNITGIYMISGLCTIPTIINATAEDDFDCGSVNCGTGWEDDWQRSSSSDCDITSSGTPIGAYHLLFQNSGGDCNAYRTLNTSLCTVGYITFWAKANSLENGEHCYYDYFNGSSHNNLLTLSNGDDDDTYRFYSYEICSTYGVDTNSSIRVLSSVGSTGDYCYIDSIDMSVQKEFNGTNYQFVRGSSELHVSDWVSNLNASIGNITINTTEIAEGVWNYPTRNLTYINFTEVLNRVDELDAQLSGNFTEILEYLQAINSTVYLNNQTLYQVWGFQTNELSSNLTEIQLYLTDINTTTHSNYNWLIGFANISESDIWNYAPRNLTYYPDSVNYTLIQEYVWNATNRTVEHDPFNYTPILDAIASSNSSIIARLDAHNGTIMTKLYGIQTEISDLNDTLLEAITNTNSSILQSIIDSNSSIIARLDAHNSTIMLKLYNIDSDIANLNDLSASQVWSYSNRTLTDYNQTEIINLLKNINLTMFNLTIGNISVSAYVNWTEGVVQMNNISNPTVVEAQVLTFAGANQDDVITTTYQYCIDNMTLGYDINTTRCWLNNCYTINETRPVPCDYGCYNHQCNPEPFDRTLFLIGIFVLIFAGLVAIALLYDRFQK